MSDEKVFSPGLAGVIGAETAVSLVDGANGKLLYRGYPIEEVVSKGSYASVLDLLLTGEWHPDAELAPMKVPPAVMAALRLLPAHAHPMDALRTAISVWGAGERLGWPPTAEEAKKIAAMAEVDHVQIAPHLYCGPIVGAANIQIATCSPNFLILESIETWGGFHTEILKSPIRFEEGHVIPSTAPGLGVELNEDVARANPYTGDMLHLEMTQHPVQ